MTIKIFLCLFIFSALSAAFLGCNSTGSGSNPNPLAGPTQRLIQPLACQNMVAPNGTETPINNILNGVPGTYQLISSDMYAQIQLTNGKQMNFVLGTQLNSSWNQNPSPNPTVLTPTSQSFLCSDFSQIKEGYLKVHSSLPGVFDHATGKITVDLKFSGQVYKCTSGACGSTTNDVQRLQNKYPDLASYLSASRPGHAYQVKFFVVNGSEIQMLVNDDFVNEEGKKLSLTILGVYQLLN